MKMKKSLFLCLMAAITMSVNSQEQTPPKLAKNELKINTVSLIVVGAIDFYYERILDEESSFGISLYVNANDNIERESLNSYKTFAFTPYYRVHFSKKYNQGFFIEGFAAYHKGNEYTYSSSYYDDYDSYNYDGAYQEYQGIALGVGIGGKWVTKKGFIAEINLGIGRFVAGGREEDVPIIGRGGIILGKRF